MFLLIIVILLLNICDERYCGEEYVAYGLVKCKAQAHLIAERMFLQCKIDASDEASSCILVAILCAFL